jgi:hypothetical protein
VKSLRRPVYNLTHKETDLLALSEAIEKPSFPLQHRAFLNSNISLAPNVKVLWLDFLEYWARNCLNASDKLIAVCWL